MPCVVAIGLVGENESIGAADIPERFDGVRSDPELVPDRVGPAPHCSQSQPPATITTAAMTATNRTRIESPQSPGCGGCATRAPGAVTHARIAVATNPLFRRLQHPVDDLHHAVG